MEPPPADGAGPVWVRGGGGGAFPRERGGRCRQADGGAFGRNLQSAALRKASPIRPSGTFPRERGKDRPGARWREWSLPPRTGQDRFGCAVAGVEPSHANAGEGADRRMGALLGGICRVRPSARPPPSALRAPSPVNGGRTGRERGGANGASPRGRGRTGLGARWRGWSLPTRTRGKVPTGGWGRFWRNLQSALFPETPPRQLPP